MSSEPIDRAAVALASGATRRGIVHGLSALLGIAVFGRGVDLGQEAEAGKRQSKRDQKRKADKRQDERKKKEEKREEKREEKKHECDSDGKVCEPPQNPCQTVACENHKCVTSNVQNGKACSGVCIQTDQCCTDDDCIGALAGACVNSSCVPAFQICTKPGSAPPVTPGTATVTYVSGGESPGQTSNSAEFSVGSDGRDWAHLRSANFAGVTLDDLEQLKYTTYTPDGGHCGNSPYMALYVTAANGGDDILVFDPGVPAPPAAVCGEWQTWDARNGLWRSIFHSSFAPQHSPKSLNAYQTNFGTVSLRNQDPLDSDCPTAFGGLRLEAGENNPADTTGGWQNFVGFIDSLEIKLAEQEKQVFNF